MRTMEEILKAVADKKITLIEAGALISAITPARDTRFGMKCSEKGCVTFKNLVGTHHKFGLSLYPETLKVLFANREEIEAFVLENASELSFGKPKDEAKSAA